MKIIELFETVLQRETPAFKAWFGNSKIVDQQGNPLCLYHGTGGDIEAFSYDNPRMKKGKLGKGIYLTPFKSKANFMAMIRNMKGDGYPSIMPLYARIENPFEINTEKNIPVNGINREKLINHGYDGIVLYNALGEPVEVVAFYPNQVKSAIGNKGTFDDSDKLNEGITEGGNFQALWDMKQEIADKIYTEYISGLPMQPWKLVSASKLISVWNQAAKDGFVRNEKDLNDIAYRMIENTLRLYFNTEIAGHTEISTEEAISDYELEVDDPEKFMEWAIDMPNGVWRISDYGLKPLINYAARLLDNPSDKEKLALIDMMLQVTHQRSDLASWFVEGGTQTLDKLFRE